MVYDMVYPYHNMLKLETFDGMKPIRLITAEMLSASFAFQYESMR